MARLLNGCMGGGGPFPTKVTCTIASPDWDSYTSTDSNAERKILRAFSSRRKSATTTGSDQCKYKHTSKQYLHLSNRADKLCISRVTNSHSTWCLTISKNICANGTRMLLIDKQRIKVIKPRWVCIRWVDIKSQQWQQLKEAKTKTEADKRSSNVRYKNSS